MGYNAVIVVKADSPYKTIEDLKGKVVARTDPLSGSGYLIPTAAFRAMGKPVDEYYKSPLSGGHPQSVLGVLKGTYDGAFTWTRKNDNIGNLRQMMNQGLLKREHIRIIWTSAPLPSPPVVIRKDLPLEMRADMLEALHPAQGPRHGARRVGGPGQDQRHRGRHHKDYTPDVPGGRREREARKQQAQADRDPDAVSQAAAQFEQQYAAYRRQQDGCTPLLFCGAVRRLLRRCLRSPPSSTRDAVDGLPRTTEFLVKLVPPIGMVDLRRRHRASGTGTSASGWRACSIRC